MEVRGVSPDCLKAVVDFERNIAQAEKIAALMEYEEWSDEFVRDLLDRAMDALEDVENYCNISTAHEQDLLEDVIRGRISEGDISDVESTFYRKIERIF